VGWQDRDWAKLGDAELEALYGTRRPRATPARRWGRWKRSIVWPATALLVLAVARFAYTQRAIPSPFAPTPKVLYGTRATLAGQPGVCTEFTADTSGRWTCADLQLLTLAYADAQVIPATPYSGPCTDLRADQDEGRWICLADTPGAPEAPDPQILST